VGIRGPKAFWALTGSAGSLKTRRNKELEHRAEMLVQILGKKRCDNKEPEHLIGGLRADAVEQNGVCAQ
jgi:hypothetical protein